MFKKRECYSMGRQREAGKQDVPRLSERSGAVREIVEAKRGLLK